MRGASLEIGRTGVRCKEFPRFTTGVAPGNRKYRKATLLLVKRSALD